MKKSLLSLLLVMSISNCSSVRGIDSNTIASEDSALEAKIDNLNMKNEILITASAIILGVLIAPYTR